MKDIYILGSGGFAKEVFWLINDINHSDASAIYNFKGFIDVSAQSSVSIGDETYKIIQEEDFIKNIPDSNAQLAIGIGNPEIIEKLYHKFSSKYLFPNLIHPDARGYWRSIHMGDGNIITSGCIFTVDIKVGSLNIFNLNTTVGHDTIIGSFNVINPGANISGGVVIGDKNLVGTNATILQNISIGNHSVLGAASLLNKPLESNAIAVGSPAKKIKENN